jgi:hypothetical protein
VSPLSKPSWKITGVDTLSRDKSSTSSVSKLDLHLVRLSIVRDITEESSTLKQLSPNHKLPVTLYRVQGFDVALENRPEGIIATVVDVPGVTAMAGSRSEVLHLVREQLAPFWKPHPLDDMGPDGE